MIDVLINKIEENFYLGLSTEEKLYYNEHKLKKYFNNNIKSTFDFYYK